jgi:hypothetical protein
VFGSQVNIVPVRFFPALGVLALVAVGACGPPAESQELHQRFESGGLAAVDVRLRIRPEHRQAQQRYVRALMATLKAEGEWLGPLPRPSLTLVDPPWRGSPAAAMDDVVMLERTPWWSSTTSMAPELATARAVSRHYWTTLVDSQALPPWFVDGVAEYAARRIVAGLFEQENPPPGYALVEQRYFHSFVPRRLPIRLLPATDGDPLAAYAANPRANPVARVPSAADAGVLTAKTVLTLGTLERWVGRPVFDQLVAEFVRQSRSGRPTIADFTRTASAASGQDLSWLFDEAFGTAKPFDYGIGSVTSMAANGAFETTVTARRFGDAQFTGATAAPVAAARCEAGQQQLDGAAQGGWRRDAVGRPLADVAGERAAHLRRSRVTRAGCSARHSFPAPNQDGARRCWLIF